MTTASQGDSSHPPGEEGDSDHKSRNVASLIGRLTSTKSNVPLEEYLKKEKEIISQAEALLAEPKIDEVQYELARLCCLVPMLKGCGQMERLDYIHLAIKALAGPTPNTNFARIVRSESEFYVLRLQRGMFRFVYRISGATSLSAVLSGVLMSAWAMIIFASLFGILVRPWMDGRSGMWSDPLIFYMALLAAAGGFISVLARLGQFAVTKAYDPFLFFTTGFFKPWVSVGFSIFLYFLLKSGIIKIGDFDPNGPTAPYFFPALAFIAGFSERFISDFISKTEDRVLGPAQAVVKKPDAKQGD